MRTRSLRNLIRFLQKRFGPFEVKSLIGKNAVQLEIPNHIKIHDVVNVIQTVPFYEQHCDIATPFDPQPDPVPVVEGEEYEVEEILNHRKRGRGYQFLTLMKESPTHDAEWQPTTDFVDKDGAVTEKTSRIC